MGMIAYCTGATAWKYPMLWEKNCWILLELKVMLHKSWKLCYFNVSNVFQIQKEEKLNLSFNQVASEVLCSSHWGFILELGGLLSVPLELFQQNMVKTNCSMEIEKFLIYTD